MIFCNRRVFHTWSKWETTEEGQIANRKSIGVPPIEGSERVIGVAIQQRRTCQQCGKLQLRYAKSYSV